jgi:8-oxo-dGTP diphosphatase
MTMIIASNQQEYRLLAIVRGDEDELERQYTPITAALVVAKCGDKFLLGFNRYRNRWEAPAGRIEEGETARECATRELYEEASQVVDELRFECLAEMLRPRGERKFTAVYSTSLRELAEFHENPEWIRIKLWNVYRSISDIDEVDLAILRSGQLSRSLFSPNDTKSHQLISISPRNKDVSRTSE